jgi:hypothetical protein
MTDGLGFLPKDRSCEETQYSDKQVLDRDWFAYCRYWKAYKGGPAGSEL